MNTFTYTISASPQAAGRTITKSQTLTGTTNVTFALSGLAEHYDDSAAQKINRVIIDFDEPGTQELIINRPLTNTTIPSISAESFSHVLQTDFIDNIKRHVYMTIYRDDLEVDVVDLTVTMKKPAIDVYENINLLKTEYFSTEQENDQLLLTFINKNPEVIGMSLIDLNTQSTNGFDPALPGSTNVNQESFNVGFTTEYVHLNASDSNSANSIKVALDNILTPNGTLKQNGGITLKYRTRAANPDELENWNIYAPGNNDLFYIPLSANSGFVHLSGFVHWNCGDLSKDIDLASQIISIPLIDIVGTRTNLADSNYYYFTNVNTGCGTAVSRFVKGGYFFVDVFDESSCDSITTTTSTITAFVNY